MPKPHSGPTEEVQPLAYAAWFRYLYGSPTNTKGYFFNASTSFAAAYLSTSSISLLTSSAGMPLVACQNLLGKNQMRSRYFISPVLSASTCICSPPTLSDTWFRPTRERLNE